MKVKILNTLKNIRGLNNIIKTVSQFSYEVTEW